MLTRSDNNFSSGTSLSNSSGTFSAGNLFSAVAAVAAVHYWAANVYPWEGPNITDNGYGADSIFNPDGVYGDDLYAGIAHFKNL